ncbi:type VI immunity family protein [Corallococcus sicarius]|nr:type VI immunity family protein [Corallococcus sicarius]
MSICFYLPKPTAEVAHAVSLSLQKYLDAVGVQTLNYFFNEDGDWEKMDESSWEIVRRKIHHPSVSSVALTSDAPYPDRYEFEYVGRDIHGPVFRHDPGAVTAVRFILPLAWMRTHGPQRVRELALALAAPLPFSSGHAGLSVTGFLEVVRIMDEVVPQLLPHPGVDVINLNQTAMEIGPRLRVPHWLTFIGDPALREMGGPDFLRAQLHTPGTTVESLDASRAVVTLGPVPEGGGPDQPLPAYRELARVLEPWAYHPKSCPGFSPQEAFHKWERRFLD